MEIQEAIDLIKGADAFGSGPAAGLGPAGSRPGPQTWADLGCGEGLFTYALSTLLSKGSQIYAIDQRPHILRYGPFPKGIKVHKLQRNFETGLDFQETEPSEDIQRDLLTEGMAMGVAPSGLPMFRFDGLLMANSLHYVADQIAFLQMARTWMMDSAGLILMEYDSDQSNPWVPYPLSFSSLSGLLHKTGFSQVQKLGQRPSLFGRAMIYSAIARI
jgi:SAM-dependent methyltransferase